MAELSQSPVSVTPGQTAAPAASGPADAAPQVSDGQAAGQVSAPDSGQPAQSGTPAGEPTFFDAATLPPELVPVYKQMQSAFTKKTQNLAKERQKVEAYDAFMVNPVENLQRMAQQYGYQITRAEARQMVKQGQADAQQGNGWQPQNWDDVMTRATEIAEQNIFQKLRPVLENVHQKSVEQELSEIDPNWRIYEDDIRATMQSHPSLVTNPELLYRASVPVGVIKSKAAAETVRKMENTVKAAQAEGRGQTSRSAPAPSAPKNFDDAVAQAKQQLAQQHGR